MAPTQVAFNPSSLRAKKIRFSSRLGKDGVLLILQILCGLLLPASLWLYLSHNRLSGILFSIVIANLVLLLWYYNDLRHLSGRLPAQGQGLVLDEALDKDVLSKLKANAGAYDIWQAIQGSFEQQFFEFRYGLSKDYFEQSLKASQLDPNQIWLSSLELAQVYGFNSITAGTVLVSLFLHTPNAADTLNALHLEQKEVESGLAWLKQIHQTIEDSKNAEHYGGLGRDWAAGYTPTLNRIAQNISKAVENGGLYVRSNASHDKVVSQMLSILANSQSSSVALVGELGVGKTTAVYMLAKKLLTEKVPSLRYHQIFSLDASSLIASTSGGHESLEKLLIGVFNEAIAARNIIVYLDEAQLFLKTGTGSVDLTNVLLPILQSGSIHLICAMSPAEWQLLSTNNPSLAGLLNYQVMPPPSPEDALQIMQDNLLSLESKHRVTFMYQSVKEAYRLADKYLHDQAFPGRGMQILEQTAVFSNGGLVTPDVVGQSLEAKLGIKVTQASGAEKQQLLNLEDELHKRLINQVQAVGVVSNALRRSRSGVSSPNRPVGTFLFLGPTGVGKTELAKALADVYFHGRDQIIRINLNEYSQPQDVSRLLTATTDQSGTNSFLAAIRRQPYSVVLMDEIEKAHPEVLNVLLQLLDEGVIRDSSNREASFKDAIVIATSNAGADIIRAQVEAGRDLAQFQEEFTKMLINQKSFTPEFLNRFDEIVLFRPLQPVELKQVVQLMLNEVNETLARQKVSVTLTPAAIDWLVTRGNDPLLGARPMRRMVQRTVENIVAKKLLGGAAASGSQISLDVPDLEAAGQNGRG